MIQLTGLDNSLAEVDFARLGALSVKTGAGGTLFFDDFESRRQSYVGLLQTSRQAVDEFHYLRPVAFGAHLEARPAILPGDSTYVKVRGDKQRRLHRTLQTASSERRARRMRNACVAFSTVIAIHRAGSARDGRHTRVVVPAREPSACSSASDSPSSMLTRISAGGGVSA